MKEEYVVASKRPLLLQPLIWGGVDDKTIKTIRSDIERPLAGLVEFLPSVRLSGKSTKSIMNSISPEGDVLLPLTSEQIIPSEGLRVDKAYTFEPLTRVNKPIFLWSKEGYYDPWNKAAQSFLALKGAEVYSFVDPTEALEVTTALRTRARMRGAKVIYLGEISDITGLPELSGVFGSDWNIERIETIWGITIKQVRISYLLDVASKISDADARRQLADWVRDIEDFGPIRKEQLLDIIKLYLAIKRIIRREQADALTINCLGDLFRERFVPPCLALGRLNDEGIVAGCEGDLNALVTMMLLNYTADTPSVMGNLYPFRPEKGPGFPSPKVRFEDTKKCLADGIARLTHDVIPLKVAKSKYILEHYHGSDRGVTTYAELPLGTVTLARIGPRMNRLVITLAEVKSVESSVHCSFSAYLQIKDLKNYVRQVSGVHSVVVYGNYLNEMQRLASIMKLDLCHV